MFVTACKGKRKGNSYFTFRTTTSKLQVFSSAFLFEGESLNGDPAAWFCPEKHSGDTTEHTDPLGQDTECRGFFIH